MARGRPFEAGNKFGRGRPRGSRNKTTVLAQELLESHAEPVVRKALMMAIQGDTAAMKLCMDRILPYSNPAGRSIARRPRNSPNWTAPPTEAVLEVSMSKLSGDAGTGTA